MATIAPRPAPALRVREAARAWLPVPLGLGALVLLALVLRTRELGVGFWIDEGLSVGIADRPFGDIPGALKLDGSPPLYYLLLHVWMQFAGSSEEAVRWLSVSFALLSVPVAWWAARGLFGTRAGWFGAVLAATNPFLTQYAQEGRMYALVAFLALVASAAFGRAFAWERRGWAVAYAVVLAAMLYTHNWALFFGAACGLVWLYLLWRSRERRETLIIGAIAFGGALLLYLPWIPTTLYQAAHTGAPWSESPTLVALLSTPGTMLGQFAQVALLLVAGAGLAAMFKRAAHLARRVVPRDRPAHRRARLDLVAGLAGVGQPLPGRRRRAAAAGHDGRPRQRGPARGSPGSSWLPPSAPATPRRTTRATCATSRAAIAPEPDGRRPRRLHAARADLGARVLPAGRPALRDAHRRGRRTRASPTGATGPSASAQPRPSETSIRCSTSWSRGSAWR